MANDELREQPQDQLQPEAVETAQADTPVKKKKFKPTKRFIIGTAVLTVLVVGIVIAAFLLANVDRRPNYGLYVKNGALYYTNFRGSSFRVTSNLTPTDGSLPAVEYDLRNCAILSDNGSYLFFPENMTISGDDVQTFDLCYQNISKKERTTVLVAKNVSSYFISNDAMTVTYLADGNLYQYELKPAESNLMCKNVYQYYVSDTSNRLVYITGNNELYAHTAGNTKAKIDNMVDEVVYISADYKTVIYRQENSLHKWINGKGESEICADVINWTFYTAGDGYLLSTQEGYSQLFYYDGQGTELIAEHIHTLIATAPDAAVAVFSAPDNEAEIPEDEAELSDYEIPEALYIAAKTTVHRVDREQLSYVGITGSGKQIYFTQQDAQVSTLYELNPGAFGLDEKIYDTDVYTQYITVTDDGRVVYFKNADQEQQTGTLYLNTAELNSGVPLQTAHYQSFGDLPDSKQIYYFTGYNADAHYGTLYVADINGGNRQISGKAYLPFMLHNGQILFLENYNAATGTCDLYVYSGGSTILIDTGVTFYIPVL